MEKAHYILDREQILRTAEDVIRRFGPTKATVVDVARALGVSHAAVYRHVASKSALRDLVVGRWIEKSMPPLRAVAQREGPAPKRLRDFIDTLMKSKRTKASADPEVFLAYRTLAADAKSVVTAHVDELIDLVTSIIASGVMEKSFRRVNPEETAQAILAATSHFHHPAHAGEWNDAGNAAAFEALWKILMLGLRR